jgi:hypothetical protein
MEITKTCTKCKEEKPLNNFNKAKYGKLGYSANCRNCASIYGKTYRSLETNKTKLKLYRENNKEKITINFKKYYDQNKEKIIKKSAEHYLANKEKAKEVRKKYISIPGIKEMLSEKEKNYRLINKEKISEVQKMYRLNNKESILEYKRNNNERIKAYKRKLVKDLKDHYIISLLTKNPILKELITPEIIELKKIQLKTLRLCQQLKN